jgi:restriction system protein
MLQLRPLPFLSGLARFVGGRLALLRGSREARVQSAARARFDTRKWSAELLRQLEWRRFEELCVAYYQAQGFTARVEGAGATGGVDIVLRDGDSERESSIAHCKAWDAYRVGAKAVRELRAAMSAAKIGKGVLLTSGRFTQEAAKLASAEGIEMIDGAALLDRMAALPPEEGLALLKFAMQGDFLTPTCPSCSIKMESRQSTREGRKFWGCPNYPACKQTFAVTANAPA